MGRPGGMEGGAVDRPSSKVVPDLLNARHRRSDLSLVVAGDEVIRPAAVALANAWGVRLARAVRSQYHSTHEWEAYVPDPPRSAEVLVLASLRPDVHAGLVQLLLIVRGLVDAGCGPIHVLIPCLPYARSDRRATPTSAIGRGVVLDALRSAGADEVLTLDLHSSPASVPAGEVTDIPTAAMLIDAAASLMDGAGIVVLPDAGARHRLGPAVVAAGLPVVELSKVRLADDRVDVACPPIIDARTAVVVDDALYTGATHAAASAAMRRMGIDRVHVVVSHALPGDGALDRLAESGVGSLTHLGTTGWHGRHDQVSVVTRPWTDAAFPHGFGALDERGRTTSLLAAAVTAPLGQAEA